MWKIVGLQWAVGASVCLLMLLMSADHARSALWGLVAVALPSTLFALRLSVGSRGNKGASGGVFLIGEFLKVGATVAIMYLASQIDPGIVWWSLVVSAVAALKSYFLAFFLR